MDEEDLVAETPASDETCPRCLEPVPRNAARCPQCGQPISSFRRMATIMAAVAGLLALIFVCVIAYRTVAVQEPDQAQVVEETVTQDGSFVAPPETSSGHETPAPPPDAAPPAPPEPPKKAPLDR